MTDQSRRLRLLLRMSLDELVELAETARLRSTTIVSTARRTGGDEASALEESLQLAAFAAEVSRLAGELIERARRGTLAESSNGNGSDD